MMSADAVRWAELTELLASAPVYRATSLIDARRLTEDITWRGSRGSDLRGRAGDWRLTDDQGQSWTVNDAVFRASYVRRDDGRYAKVATVRAVRLDAPLSVPTLEGEADAQAGDWILRGVAGEFWPVTDGYFRRNYRPVRDA